MKNRSGFTIMEMMIVIAIIGITAAVAIPSYLSNRPNHRAMGAAREIYTELYLAKMKAASENTPYTITFNDGTETMTISGTDTKTITISDEYPGTEIKMAHFTGGDGNTKEIRYMPTGILEDSKSGSIEIQPVSATGQVQTITVSVTGHVSLD